MAPGTSGHKLTLFLLGKIMQTVFLSKLVFSRLVYSTKYGQGNVDKKLLYVTDRLTSLELPAKTLASALSAHTCRPASDGMH